MTQQLKLSGALVITKEKVRKDHSLEIVERHTVAFENITLVLPSFDEESVVTSEYKEQPTTNGDLKARKARKPTKAEREAIVRALREEGVIGDQAAPTV